MLVVINLIKRMNIMEISNNFDFNKYAQVSHLEAVSKDDLTASASGASNVESADTVCSFPCC
jgi:hypothetical protein